MRKLYECTDALYEFDYDIEKIPNLADEQDLLSQYRKLSDEDKEIVKGFVNILHKVRSAWGKRMKNIKKH